MRAYGRDLYGIFGFLGSKFIQENRIVLVVEG